jgi:hypothetical protein
LKFSYFGLGEVPLTNEKIIVETFSIQAKWEKYQRHALVSKIKNIRKKKNCLPGRLFGDSGGHPAATKQTRLHDALLTPLSPEEAVGGRGGGVPPLF